MPCSGVLVPVTPLELAAGWVFGYEILNVPPTRRGGARQAADAVGRVVERSLDGRPCYVAFSGGRDSSAILAVATHVARRAGLPDPVPVTNVFPGDPAAEESAWQESVVRHLQLREWIRREATSDVDLVGERTAPWLERFGVVWPPTAYSNLALYAVGSGGVMLTGEGGDNVFGPQRVTGLRRLAMRSRPSKARLRAAARAIFPRTNMAERGRGIAAQQFPWLSAAARDEVASALAADEHRSPLHWYRAMLRSISARAGIVGLHNLGVIARTQGTWLDHPLRDPFFLSSLAPVAGRWGFVDRSSFMAAVFGHLLPSPVLARTTKARFNTVLFGNESRRFAQTWDGSGVDQALVDADRLQAEWLSPEPSGMTCMLLQQAWLAGQPSKRDGK